MGYYSGLGEKWQPMYWLSVKYEQGAKMQPLIEDFERTMRGLVERLAAAPVDAELLSREPNGLEEIRALRPEARRIWPFELSDEKLLAKIKGAWFGRCAGCILSADFRWRMEEIKTMAQLSGAGWPLDRYIRNLDPERMKYNDRSTARWPENLSYVPTDDDTALTLLGLMVLEQHGTAFTSADVARAWLEYFPPAWAYGDLDIAHDNLRSGLEPPASATHISPKNELLGAAIRADTWGYAAPGMPEFAAEMGWRDATISHVRNGIYGEMFWAAAISVAFVCSDIQEAIVAGLAEIPAKCRLAGEVKWALETVAETPDWEDFTRKAQQRYQGMSNAHSLNHAALVTAGLLYGGGDFTRTIGITVSMGFDNDCTAATAGSLYGALFGIEALDPRWYEPFGDRVHTFLKGHEWMKTSDIVQRFLKIAKATRLRDARSEHTTAKES